MDEQKQNERYLAGRREWLERYGDYIAQAKNWRTLAFVSAGIAALFGAGMVYEADRVHVVPYVVEVNRLGESVHLAQAVQAGALEQPIVRHVLTHWLRLVRERVPNKWAEQQFYDDSYKYVVGQARDQLNGYFQRHNPYNDYVNKKGGRTVTIVSALPVGKQTATGGTFQIQWRETQYDGQNGNIDGKTQWEGTVSYTILPPSKNPRTLESNPFGIYITSFNWNPMA